MKKKHLPKFRNTEKFARFCETHDMTDYMDQMEDVTDLFTFAPELIKRIKERARKKMVTIRLANWEIVKAKEIAKRKKMPYQTFLRDVIDVGLRENALISK